MNPKPHIPLTAIERIGGLLLLLEISHHLGDPQATPCRRMRNQGFKALGSEV